jgi:hypothetical protein
MEENKTFGAPLGPIKLGSKDGLIPTDETINTDCYPQMKEAVSDTAIEKIAEEPIIDDFTLFRECILDLIALIRRINHLHEAKIIGKLRGALELFNSN